MAVPAQQQAELRTAVRSALVTLQRVSNVPLVFSGIALPRTPHEPMALRLRLDDFVGAHSGALSGLDVAPCTGLGGRAVGAVRPQVVTNYKASRMISHEYDAQVVESERLSSMCALPLVVHGSAQAVIYLATRDGVLGDRVIRQAARHIHEVGRDLSARERLTAPLVQSTADAVRVLDRILGATPDPDVRPALLAVRRHLTADSAFVPQSAFTMRPRELDVLRLVAQGRTNLQIGSELGLREPTVKTYLSSAMRKLEVRNRTSAVRAARAAGLL